MTFLRGGAASLSTMARTLFEVLKVRDEVHTKLYSYNKCKERVREDVECEAEEGCRECDEHRVSFVSIPGPSLALVALSPNWAVDGAVIAKEARLVEIRSG